MLGHNDNWGAAMLEVTREETVMADPQTVWSLVSNFGGIAEWHPACSASSQETVGDEVRRTIVVGESARLIEKLESIDNDAKSISYSIIEGPLPVENYLSTLTVSAQNGNSHLVWTGKFDAKGAADDRAKQIVAGIYESGLGALKKRFG